MNIWLVAFYFPPINIIGAERPKKFLRHFSARGFAATIFSVTVPGHEGKDEYEGFACRRSTVAFEDYHFRSAGSKKRPSPMRLFVPRVLTALLGDSGWTWMPSLRRDLEQAWSEGNRPDVILATGRPFLTFLTVSRFARRHKIPFVLDYRDAWWRNPHPSHDTWFRRSLTRWLEGRVNRQASAVVTVSNLTAAALNSAGEPLVIYNLPDQGYMDEIQGYLSQADAASPDRLALTFTGTLYPGRDLDPVCAAVARLEPSLRDRIDIHYCGNSAAQAEAACRRHGIENRLISHGSLSKADAVRLVAGSDVALSIICSEEETENDALRGVITTKVFDYLILDKDVLNIVPDGFEFNTFASEFGLAGLVNFRPGDLDGIERFIREKLEKKLSEGENAAGDGAASLSAAWAAQMAKLDALLMDVVR